MISAPSEMGSKMYKYFNSVFLQLPIGVYNCFFGFVLFLCFLFLDNLNSDLLHFQISTSRDLLPFT